MRRLPGETLTAIGRMTVAATELEHVLAWIGADQAGGDADAVFRRPGEPLRAARGSVQFASPARRDELIAWVEGAGTQLALGQAVLRALWREDTSRREDSLRREDDRLADPGTFDEVTARLLRCRDRLLELATAELDGLGDEDAEQVTGEVGVHP